MKKIVILKGSPRKKGNTNAMADVFAEEMKKTGNEVDIFDTTTMKLSGCRACNGCFAKKECVIKDDFQEISETLISADGIVIAAPVYWYTFPAQIKAAIDRFYSIYGGGHTFTGKKVALLSCCEEDTTETFDGIKFAFEKTMAFMDATIVDEILMPGVVDAGDIYKTDGIDKAKELVNKF